MSWPIAFRADADGVTGAGHFMRCLSLAHACKASGANPTFFTATEAPGLLKRVADAGFELVRIAPDAPDLGVRVLAAWASANSGSWAVLDGYRFNGAYQLAVRQAGARLMVIDDQVRLPRYHAELILDQNLGAEARDYPAPPGTRRLLGPRYAVLSPAFSAVDTALRVYPGEARSVLVTLGGADPHGVTLRVICGLAGAGLEGVEVTVVIGAANVKRSETRESAARHGYRVVEDAADMPELMMGADLAITAGGTTAWEACRAGLPFISIILADNQRAASAALREVGIARVLGWHEQVTGEAIGAAVRDLVADRTARERMGRAGSALVDGKGAARVVAAITGSPEAP